MFGQMRGIHWSNQLSRVSGSKIEGRLGEAVDDRLGRANCRLRHAPECPRALGERIYSNPALAFALSAGRGLCAISPHACIDGVLVLVAAAACREILPCSMVASSRLILSSR